ncbi:hypothetical protein KGF57_001074 [Candida theae]|uniref:Cell wall mannoprotein PIR1-like C-terminal domain-containing protein n=1 Tax=Candida theae TaxID=1198502 RepID=A0AAD5BI84_9ASCO|nr:uncharacterized protein KGF57_001074 [Candida theae]KAI5964401.1 hypothetical protein KGF57_001074 [Candida theae]
MKFTAALISTFGLVSVANSSLIQRGYDDDDGKNRPTPTDYPPHQPKVTSFPNKFALGAKVGDDIFIAFELSDGQIEYGTKKYTIPCVTPTPIVEPCDTATPTTVPCEEPTPEPVTYTHPHPSKPWKRDGFDFDNDDSWLTFDNSLGYDWFTLKNSVLRDSKYRIGEIAANHQFQFDSPVQPDALFSSGFSIVHDDGYWLLALNGKTAFWDSPVNDYGVYKVYNAPINPKSRQIELVVIVLV